MKILILSHYFHPSIGGIELVSKILSHAFVDAGHSVHVLTWSPDSNATPFPFKVIRNPNALTLIKEHAWADVVFENNIAIRLSWPRMFFNKPTLIALHTWLTTINGETSIQWKIKKLWLKSAKKVVACSEIIRDSCWPDGQVIRNPYQDNIFKITNNNQRSRDFVFLGRLVSDKGADLAIEALHILKQEVPDKIISLTIIGDGPELENLKKLTETYKLTTQVTFKGAMQGIALANCLNTHKSMVVPSRWLEPFGIVALEGMACGCIPIVSDGGGLPFAVGKGGLTFKRNDAEDLASKMHELLDNSSLVAKLKMEIPSHLEIHNSKNISAQYLSAIVDIKNA
ncbi:glycosyltransferase [Kriegella sp. EG-1]|nr:glycosyltransferase [Flavobacteriaceae bacterium EG-1]